MSINFFRPTEESWIQHPSERFITPGWVSPESESYVFDFAHLPLPKREKLNENNMVHKKFYNGINFIKNLVNLNNRCKFQISVIYSKQLLQIISNLR